ncbi:putative holin-like toxin [Ligilactobacillus acidipiscis]
MKGVARVSVSDALQLMLAFGTFIVALIALVVELIKMVLYFFLLIAYLTW